LSPASDTPGGLNLYLGLPRNPQLCAHVRYRTDFDNGPVGKPRALPGDGNRFFQHAGAKQEISSDGFL
jgi:hypothetical protein